MNYNRARDLTARNGRKKVAHNTYLECDEITDDIHLRYHWTNVVTYHADGTMTLRTGGWRSSTTKDRLNRFTPSSVWSEGGVWFLCGMLTYPATRCVRIEFEEGMRVDERGRPIDFTSYEEVA